MTFLGVLGIAFFILGCYTRHKRQKGKTYKPPVSKARPEPVKPTTNAELKAMERWFRDEEY